MSHLKSTQKGLMAALLFFVFLFPIRALALPIGPGFDLFHTPDGGAFIDFTPFSLGLGIVDLTGDPIGPGNTDTIVERKTGLGDGATGTIQIELVALSLVSVSPVDIGGSLFDIFVTLDTGTASTGEMDVTSHSASGGTFNSFIDVFAEVTLTEISNPSNMFNILVQDQITSTGTSWSHTPPPDYPMDPNYPSGDFYSGPIEHTGPHPEAIPSVIPLPAGLPLFAAGIAVISFLGWRRRKNTILA